jgi:predicted short-subunit dehydrogenase-like oxidoreductase (DUF2520 family)
MQKLADTNFAIVGPGDLGLALAKCLVKHKANVLLTGRNLPEATRQAEELGLDGRVQPMLNSVIDADIVLLTVPDKDIESLCKTLSINFKQGAVVTHFSGLLDHTVLKSAKRKAGVHICSLHPMNVFSSLEETLKLFSNRLHGTHLYGEGEKEALAISGDIFKQIGFFPVQISTKAKIKYHAATIMAHDYLTVLVEACMSTAESAGISRQTFWRSLQPMVKGTLISIGEHGPEYTLNGPISMGDTQTIEKHLDELADVVSSLPRIYADLGKHALSLAVKKGGLDREHILRIHALLDKALEKES